MRKRIFLVVILFSASAFSQTSASQPKTSQSKPTGNVSSETASKIADIRRLLQLTGNLQMVNQMKAQMIEQLRQTSPNLPPEMLTELSNEMRAEDLENSMVPIYSKHFTEAEIKQLINFYDSPFGKKLIREMPQIIAEANLVGADWGQGIMKRVAKKWRDAGKITDQEYERLTGEDAP